MKKTFFNAGFYLCGLMLCLFLRANGQANILTLSQVNPTGLSACLEADTFKIIISNTSSSQIAEQVNLSLTFPSSGITFAGFVSCNAGILTVVDPNANQPIFLINEILPLQTLELTYTARADCAVLSDVRANTIMINNAAVNYRVAGVGFLSTSLSSAQSYNVWTADLDIAVNIANIEAEMGMYFGFFNAAPDGKRITTITNSGDGSMDTIRLIIKAEPEISYTGFYSTGGVSIPFSIDANGNIVLEFYGSWIQLFGNNTGLNDFMLDEDEKLTVIEDFVVVSCSDTEDQNTFDELQWGCDSEICDTGNNEQTSANVHVNSGAPRIVQTIGNNSAVTNYCREGDLLTFKFTNTASGLSDFATDFVMDVISTSNYTPLGFSLYDFTLNGQLVNPALVQQLNNIQWIGFPSDPGHVTPGYRIDLSANTNPLYASDLDGDLFYDDLAAGFTFTLTAKIRFDQPQPFENQCSINYYGMFGLPQSHYKAACSEDQLESLDYSKAQFYSAALSPNSLANLITGPTDMIENQTETFTFCTGSWINNMDFFSCPIDSHYVSISLPDGYFPVGNDVLFSSIAGDSSALISIVNGNQLIISGGAKSFIVGQEKTWNGCYQLQLAFSCDSTATGTIDNESDLSWKLNYICDTCAVIQTRVCSSVKLFNHAGCSSSSLSCDGVVSSGFDVNRTTFGWTDYSLTTRVQASDPGINLDAAYTYDTIQTITSGLVRANNYDQLFTEIRYESNSELIKWTNGTVRVLDASGNIFTVCPIVSPPVLTLVGTKYSYVFTLPIACMGAMGSDFQIQVLNSWEVLNSSTIKSFKVYDIPLFRSNFHFTRNDSIFKCDEWGAKFSLYNYGSYPFIYAEGVHNCDPLKVRMHVKNYGGSNGDDFPNEIRHLFRLDRRMVLHIPPGYSFVNGSGFSYQVLDASNPLSPITTLIPLNPIFQDADSVVFDYDWPVMDKYEQSGSVNIYPPLIQFQLQPDCDRAQQTIAKLDYGYTNYDYASYIPYHVAESSPDEDYTINNPVPRITVNTGAFIVDAYTNKVSWQVQLCNQVGGNQSVVGDALNLWIDADNVASNAGNIIIDSVYVSQGDVQKVVNYPEGTDVNSLLELGNLSANTCRTYTLEGSFVNCADLTDSLRIRTAWSCAGYPEPENADDANCYVSENLLAVRYKTANLSTTITAIDEIVNTCDTVSYLIELQSTGPAFMYDVDFWAELPQGSTILNPQYLYTVQSGIWKNLANPDNTFAGMNPRGWHLSQVLNEWKPYNGGFRGNQKPDSAKIQLRFDLALNCELNPNDSIVFHSKGISNCGDPVEFRAKKRFQIAGFEQVDKLALEVLTVDTLFCNETGIIDLQVSNLNSFPNQFQDSVEINIPNNLTVLNATVGGNMTFSANYTSVKWKIDPQFINGNDKLVFSVYVLASNVDSCTELQIPSSVFYVGRSQCGETVCTPKAILAETITAVTLCCDVCQLSADFIADTVCYSACCGGADTTCFRLLDQNTIGADYSHSWDFGDGFISIDDEPCHIYDTVGVYYACHTVTQFSTGCFETFCDSVRVIDKPRGAIELLGCNPFCEGDTVYLTVNGSYASIEWIELPSGTIVGSDDTLAVSKAGRYNAVLSNGVCTSECLAIDVQTQQAPEIDIPDTAFCLGDSIFICAGGGFSSYEWQLNGIIINTGDSCIWIKSVGEYKVTVGQKAPYGCCTCKGVDTFTVIINTIAVSVPDLIICENTSAALCATPSGGYQPYSYQWQANGEITPCITVNAAGDYIARLTDAMGCTAVDTGRVTLDLIPSAEFTYEDTICIQDETCFDAVNAGNHQWTIRDEAGNIISTYSTDGYFCYKFTAVGNYEVEHILSNACGSDTVKHIITVVPPVEACIVLTGQNPFCAGDTVCLSVNDPFGQVKQIEWYRNDILVFVGAVFCVTEPGTYRAVVTDNHGCTSECMCIVLTQNPAPVLDLPDNVTICVGQVNAVLDAGAGQAEYIWFRNNVFYAYGVSSVNVTTDGTYRVEVRAANGCKAIDSTRVNLALGFTIIGSTRQSVCRNETFTVFTTCDPNLSYEWFMAGNSVDQGVPVANSDTCRLTLSGNQLLGANTWFNVVVTNKITGCTSRAQIRLIHRTRNCNEIELVPNPVLGNTVVVTYDLMDAGVNTALFEFRNVLGDLVATYPTDPELQEANLDISELSNGVYHVSLIADGVAIDSQRLVVAR